MKKIEYYFHWSLSIIGFVASFMNLITWLVVWNKHYNEWTRDQNLFSLVILGALIIGIGVFGYYLYFMLFKYNKNGIREEN